MATKYKLATRNLQTILAHQLAGRSTSCIAALMNVNRDTIRTWMKTPEYIELYNETKDELLDAVTDTFIGGALEAVQLLRVAINDSHVAPADRIGAAIYLTDVTRELIAQRDGKRDTLAVKPLSECSPAEQVERIRAEQAHMRRLLTAEQKSLK
jgi:hypothetical protein